MRYDYHFREADRLLVVFDGQWLTPHLVSLVSNSNILSLHSSDVEAERDRMYSPNLYPEALREVEAIVANYSQGTTYLLGWSLGALMALTACLSRPQCSGAILLAPSLYDFDENNTPYELVTEKIRGFHFPPLYIGYEPETATEAEPIIAALRENTHNTINVSRWEGLHDLHTVVKYLPEALAALNLVEPQLASSEPCAA